MLRNLMNRGVHLPFPVSFLLALMRDFVCLESKSSGCGDFSNNSNSFHKVPIPHGWYILLLHDTSTCGNRFHLPDLPSLLHRRDRSRLSLRVQQPMYYVPLLLLLLDRHASGRPQAQLRSTDEEFLST